MDTYRLNVIFHGPFIFVFYKDRVEVLGAEIDEHDVGVGNWKEEQPCNAGTYNLKGIKKQTSKLPPDAATHVIINAEALTNMKIAQDAYYRFVLPAPSLMRALGLLTPKSQPFICDDEQDITIPPLIGSAHVLSYEINKTDNPHFYNFPWKPKTTSNGELLQATNVHIFSESPFVLDDLHPNRDFGRSMMMLPGLFLDILEPFPDVDFNPGVNIHARELGVTDPEQGGLRGLPEGYTGPNGPLVPPRICDAPSLVITNAG